MAEKIEHEVLACAFCRRGVRPVTYGWNTSGYCVYCPNCTLVGPRMNVGLPSKRPDGPTDEEWDAEMLDAVQGWNDLQRRLIRADELEIASGCAEPAAQSKSQGRL